MEVVYIPKFMRQLKSLTPDLQDETIEKIGLFKDPANQGDEGAVLEEGHGSEESPFPSIRKRG